MSGINEGLIRDVVHEVLSRLQNNGSAGSRVGRSVGSGGVDGIFQNVNDAVAAAKAAFEQLSAAKIETRAKAIECIREICIQQAEELGRFELDETRIGRIDHKIDKLVGVGKTIKGVEMLSTEAYSGDYGITLVEHAPYGVLGVITPVTHSIPTLACNAIMMIA
ncbi:MAG: aldehyde dehydrogenase family protein, partial [Phycisphaerae bacterium]|nr:aldehyde dehydrogenase family protein [Phycisphaerae bacterium]